MRSTKAAKEEVPLRQKKRKTTGRKRHTRIKEKRQMLRTERAQAKKRGCPMGEADDDIEGKKGVNHKTARASKYKTRVQQAVSHPTAT